MKFLCDRCKTRYSIGDDRVRGKILKIRCKNCANVITVREGMTDAEPAEAAPAARRNAKPTTMSPPIASAAPAAMPPAANGALGAAFASAMTRPPPALEEEWYVSIDGNQEGPFSLAEAQRWIGAKAFDADLHCWSEGFDDWLPVDKVSHFRGLRKKPAPPTAPPPLPRATGAVPALRAQPAVEEEPKPLFAATMASLEKGVSPAVSSAALGMPSVARPSASPPLGQPRYPSPAQGQPRYPSPVGGSPAIPSIQARTNGSATGPAKPIPVPSVVPPAAGNAALKAKPGAMPRAETRPGVASQFDTGSDQATQIDSPAFEMEAQTHAEPAASQAKRAASEQLIRDDAPTMANTPRALRDEPAVAPAPRMADAPLGGAADDDDEDDGLSIGEVSRVVNLADLTRSKKPEPAIAQPIARRTTSNPALGRTGAVAKLNATGAVARMEDPSLAPNGISADPSVVPGTEMAMQPAPAAANKRGMIILIGVAALLLAGVVVAVVMLAGGEETTGKGLSRTDTIDTSRPDDPLRPRTGSDTQGTGSAGSAAPTNPFFPPKNPTQRPKNPGTGTQTAGSGAKDPVQDLPGTGDSLSPEDIDVVSKKYSGGTQRCYMHAQKGVDAITIGAVKSIQATLTVSKDGVVTDVLLASHADDSLGKCLINALRGWRFRANPGGRVKFTLAFAQQ